MANLIALLSSGKGTWAQVNSLINAEKWDKVYLICNEYAYENYDAKTDRAMKLKFDEKHPTKSFEKLADFFKKEIKDFEIALNLSSGTGLEHMTVLSAILRAGLGIRFVYFDFNELKEFEIFEQKFIPEEEEDL